MESLIAAMVTMADAEDVLSLNTALTGTDCQLAAQMRL